MKAMMQRVKRRFTKQAPDSQELQSIYAKLDSPDFMEHKDLPRFRTARQVPRALFTDQLPGLREVEPEARDQLFLRKLRLCMCIFTFSSDVDAVDVKQKEVKRATLLELVEFLCQKPQLSQAMLQECFEMISVNIFRPLPPSVQYTPTYNPEEDEPTLVAAWPHLQVVYEFFLRLISLDIDVKVLKRFVHHHFLTQLLGLFDSEDPRERDYLKTITHRIYGKFMSLRPFIRKTINNIFFTFMLETDRHNGISELLEILGSIINGFALPLKAEHKIFLSTVLLPLHKATYLSAFHPQLSYCITQFVEKEAALGPVVIADMIKYWPQTASKKQVLLLGELEEVLDRTPAVQLRVVMVPLFSHLARCTNSSHFQVAERAIFVLNNKAILDFIGQNREQIIPILHRALISRANRAGALFERAGRVRAFSSNADTHAAVAAKAVAPKSPVLGAAGKANANEAMPQDLSPKRELRHATHPDGPVELRHWNPMVSQLTADFLAILTEMSSPLVASLNAASSDLSPAKARMPAWAALEAQCAQLRSSRNQQSDANGGNNANSYRTGSDGPSGGLSDGRERFEHLGEEKHAPPPSLSSSATVTTTVMTPNGVHPASPVPGSGTGAGAGTAPTLYDSTVDVSTSSASASSSSSSSASNSSPSRPVSSGGSSDVMGSSSASASPTAPAATGVGPAPASPASQHEGEQEETHTLQRRDAAFDIIQELRSDK